MVGIMAGAHGPPAEGVGPTETAEMLRERAAIEERREARADARRNRNITMLVAALGVLGTITATYVTARNQRSQAEEQFFLSERRTAYADYISTAHALQLAGIQFTYDPKFDKPLNDTTYRTAREKYIALLNSADMDFTRSAAVVALVGSEDYRAKAMACYISLRRWERAIGAAIDNSYDNNEPYDAASIRDQAGPAFEPCLGLNFIGHEDLSLD